MCWQWQVLFFHSTYFYHNLNYDLTFIILNIGYTDIHTLKNHVALIMLIVVLHVHAWNPH